MDDRVELDGVGVGAETAVSPLASARLFFRNMRENEKDEEEVDDELRDGGARVSSIRP